MTFTEIEALLNFGTKLGLAGTWHGLGNIFWLVSAEL